MDGAPLFRFCGHVKERMVGMQCVCWWMGVDGGGSGLLLSVVQVKYMGAGSEERVDGA